MRGRRRGLVPGGERGGGVCEGDTTVSQLVRVAGCAVRTPGTGLTAMSPFPPPPSTPAAGCSFRRSHRLFSFEAVSCLWFSCLPSPRARADRRPIQATGCPRSCLRRPLRTRRVTVRCLWRSRGAARRRRGSRVWLPFGSGSPIPRSPCLSDARSGPRRTPAWCAAGGTPPAPACGRRSTAPCRCRASTATSPGTPSSSRPSGR